MGKIRRIAVLLIKSKILGFFSVAIKDIHFGSMQTYKRKKAEENGDIKFSILVPLYNTPKNFLKDMIDSVENQSYANWELCLADGSDLDESIGDFVKAYNDPRIKYKKLEKNIGISGNTNACTELASGEYICLLDHDDMLSPTALSENYKLIKEQNCDFVYSDELMFEKHGKMNIISFHYKPDFAPDNLRANNYICHFSVFSRKLFDKAGYFNSEYDGSQDHDLILRLTENAEKIGHISKALYYWRIHSGSVASKAECKPYAIEAGKKAVHDSILRKDKRESTVKSSNAHPTIYNIEYDVLNEKVGIIAPKSVHAHIAENTAGDFSLFEKLSDVPQNVKYVVFFDKDVRIITKTWLKEMLMFAQRADVGAVGAKLLYPDGKIYHAGITVGIKNGSSYDYHGVSESDNGYMGRLVYARNVSAVSGQCMMLRHELVNNGTDMFNIASAIRFCVDLRKKGFVNVITPLAKMSFLGKPQDLKGICANERDPYFNPNFSKKYTYLRLKKKRGN